MGALDRRFQSFHGREDDAIAEPEYWAHGPRAGHIAGPPLGARITIAVAIALACGLASHATTRLPGFRDQDFASWWLGARAVLAGQDPYATVTTGAGSGFVYPLPAAIAAVPFAHLRASVAGPVWVGLCCGILSFAITKRVWWPLIMFLSGAMLLSVISAQWSPILTAGAVVPALMWVGVFKPNIGLAIFAARPGARTAVAVMAIVAVCVAIQPSWIAEWVRVTARSRVHFSPVRTTGGFLLLCVLLRWRRPEARLVALLAVLPSSPIVYETLPLFLVARRKLELVLLAALSDVVYLFMAPYSLQHDTDRYFSIARPAIVWLMYAPAALMIVARPNVGRVPAAIETAMRRAPAWLRGTPPAEDALMDA